MHKLLVRQLKRHFGSIDSIPEEWKSLLDTVDIAYHEFDADRSLLERSMELVSGETLAERIERAGPLAVSDALSLCRQIAEALEAAHEKGVVHRDLKPGNVKVTPQGRVMTA